MTIFCWCQFFQDFLRYILDIVLSWMRYLGGFRSSRYHGSNRKNEIYNLRLVPEPPELNKLWKYRKYFVEHFGTLFCHEWRVLEFSRAENYTVRTAKMRSTIWDWSQSLRSTLWHVLAHCFVTNEVFWRFPELLMVPIESSRRDLQSGNGPGASGAQTIMKI